MSGTHGELFQEIGKLVLAAHAGQSIDLAATSEELAERFGNLDMPPEMIARAIARSLSAISVSMAVVANGHEAAVLRGTNGLNGHPDSANGNGHANGANGNGHFNGNGNGHANGHSNGGDHVEHNDIHAGEDEVGATDLQPAEDQAEASSALFPSGLRLSVLN